jgi:hypothetical protein
MRTYRSIFLSLGGLALCASMVTFGTIAIPTAALACPGEAHAGEGKCDCGKDKADCEAAKADGSCAGCDKGDCGAAKADGSCGGCDKGAAAKDGKACACVPGDDGKCTCGAECPAHHGGKCPKEGAAAPGKKEGGCHGEDHDHDKGASVPSGTKGLVAAVDPATGELVTPDAAKAAGLTGSASVAVPTAGTKAAHEVAGGAGTMAAFPENRISRTVATVDADGKAHIGCQH